MAIERNYFITMHHQAGVHFENFTEVKFRDILLTGTGHRDSPGQTETYDRPMLTQIHVQLAKGVRKWEFWALTPPP